MTVLEVLSAASGYLGKHDVESPRLNAEHLLAHVLGKKRLDLYLEFDRPLSEAERAPLRELIRERGTGRPLQHLLGTAEFFGHSFLCDARALIPRPETEQLVELVLSPQPSDSGHILDVGTGSGIIAITLAHALPSAVIEATDISAEALSLARENAVRHALQERITFHEADLLPPADGQFSLIIANLPYIATAELDTLQREVHHDPRLALDGGTDGLALIERLAADVPHRLNPGGILALEIGHDQASRVSRLLGAHNFRDITIHPDYQGIDRFVLAKYG